MASEDPNIRYVPATVEDQEAWLREFRIGADVTGPLAAQLLDAIQKLDQRAEELRTEFPHPQPKPPRRRTTETLAAFQVELATWKAAREAWTKRRAARQPFFAQTFGEATPYPSLTTKELDELEHTINRLERAYTVLTKRLPPPRPGGRPRGTVKGNVWTRQDFREWYQEAGSTYAREKPVTLQDLGDAMGVTDDTASRRLRAVGLLWPPTSYPEMWDSDDS